MKGELRETQKRLDLVEAELGRAEITASSLARLLSELAARSEGISEERRHAERESANQSAALRQMDAEVARIERRLDDWVVQSERNKDLRNVRQALIEEKREETARLDAEHEASEVKVNELQQNVEELRRDREEAQQQAASVSAILAGLEERSRGAEAAFTRIDRMYGDLERRVNQLEQQLASATAEEQQRTRENEQLEVERERLTEVRRGRTGRSCAIDRRSPAVARTIERPGTKSKGPAFGNGHVPRGTQHPQRAHRQARRRARVHGSGLCERSRH